MGFRTSPDVARQYFEMMDAKGLDTMQVRGDKRLLQKEILRRALENAGRYLLETPVFFDYGLPDNIVFSDLSGIRMGKVEKRKLLSFRYRHVFILEPLPISNDRIRIESRSEQEVIFKSIRRLYFDLGYDAIVIPHISIDARIEIVMKALSGGLRL